MNLYLGSVCFIHCVHMQQERDWNSWDESPRTVDEHIEQYRQKLVQPSDAAAAEAPVDFFQVINRKRNGCDCDTFIIPFRSPPRT